jgi:hypothetical protein
MFHMCLYVTKLKHSSHITASIEQFDNKHSRGGLSLNTMSTGYTATQVWEKYPGQK